ncbi:DNA polymerase-3 subunit gamma/tau [Ruminiclostridium sufflavum DSM 19573]|uniref:DNA-directed DNA polymerase n=1 Tax=Ruminiclostridium sufflavum DSM 19573 TaxID=1121337 RepID=A0A318XNI1_9FIRM|nr:DNA polymerase III subunit gamma/tau [Ruminiclostridium sufflavum]PYG89562.1 DNA polymerase-3 subunit gamma/tau [Ruminiclostridium sufflavum DSM 19573]
MSYTALYRKWRPLVFEDVVEQEHVVKTIKNTVMSGRIGHAYLFCGTRGTGKTTMAKIFARAINCLNPKEGDPCNECEICKGILSDSVLDVIEIDAASNNSVDNVREIRDEVVYAPSQAKYKVYIIDEVHMLSAGAFNALLKTLEEPPAHVVFILATTDPHKLPATILSRCQRFDFKKITLGSIAQRVQMVAAATDIQIEEDAALLIARLADGAMRDALSILDQCIAVGDKTITHQNVLDVIGIVSDDFIAEIVDHIRDKNTEGLVGGVEKLSSGGRDILRFASDLVMYFRNLLMCKLSRNPSEIVDVSKQYIEKMMVQAEAFSRESIIAIIKELSSFEPQLKYALNQRVFLEVMLISISMGNYGQSADNGDLIDRISDLEDKIKNTAFVSQNSGIKTGAKYIPEGSPWDEAISNNSEASKDIDKKNTSSKKAEYEQLEIWDNVISELKALGRMRLVAYLASTKAVAVDGSTVMVVFPKDFCSLKSCVTKPEDIEILENIISKKLTRNIRVKIVDEETLESMVPFKASIKQEPQEKELQEFSQEISSKLNVHLDIIDE